MSDETPLQSGPFLSDEDRFRVYDKLGRARPTVLGDAARDKFLDLLENPHPPVRRLREAARAHSRRVPQDLSGP